VAESTGWKPITVDHDPRHGATHCEDIMTMDYKALPTPDHLHASVDCTTYSLAAHGAHRLSEERAAELGLPMGLPISEAARNGDALLARVLEIIAHFLALNPRMTVSIENPRGYLRHHPAMQLLHRVEATYISYGWPCLKPTDFWVNFPLELTYEPARPTELLISKAPAAALREAFRSLVSPLGIDVDAVESNASLRSMMPPALVQCILKAAAAATQIFPWPDAAVVSKTLAHWDAQSRESMAAVSTASDASVAAPPGDAPITACGDVGASGGVAADAEAAAETEQRAMRRRDGVEYAPLERERGALVAPSRTAEGYKLPCGTGLTCLVDATYNGIMALAPSVKPSLARMVAKAVPTLGNARQASWASMQAALAALQYPVALVEATARFKAAGGPMLNMLRTKGAVLVVGLHVRIDGAAQQHCVMLSTLPEPHAPYGKLVDNHGQMRPVYLEAKDLASKPAAARAFRELIAQNPAARECTELTVEPSDVYELVATGAGLKRPAEASVGPAKAPRLGERVCAACSRALPTEAFSKTQRDKGPNGRCRECVERA